MKKYLFILLILTAATSCKKTEFAPEGPTDVRVRNLSDINFTRVIVKIKEEADTLGDISAGNISEYSRFEIAYPKAEISALVNGQLFSTGVVNYSGMQYIGRDRITYEVYISNMNTRELKINNVVIEEPLVLK
jgi:hypothetical protein